jgi:hypothetical protein
MVTYGDSSSAVCEDLNAGVTVLMKSVDGSDEITA